MRRNKLKIARVLLLMGMGAALGVSVQGLLPFHIMVIVGLFLLLVQGARRGFLWAALAGLLYETVSPFPPFTFFAALFATLGVSAFILAKYVSHRTFFGALVIGGIGGALYELFTFLFSHVGKITGDGWLPAWDWHYTKFILLRAVATAITLGILTLLAKQISPGVRGVMIAYQRP